MLQGFKVGSLKKNCFIFQKQRPMTVGYELDRKMLYAVDIRRKYFHKLNYQIRSNDKFEDI